VSAPSPRRGPGWGGGYNPAIGHRRSLFSGEEKQQSGKEGEPSGISCAWRRQRKTVRQRQLRNSVEIEEGLAVVQIEVKEAEAAQRLGSGEVLSS